MLFLDLGWVESTLRSLMASICQLIYPLIAWLYNLFVYISRVNILSEDQVAPIYQRVTMLLTIVMVFYVTFQFVKFIVQPDEITDKEKGTGKIIYKMVAVVVLIAFVPKIFDGAFWLQNKILDNGLIEKVMLGTANAETKNFGRVFSANLFSLFYKFEADPEKGIEEEHECDGAQCKLIVNMNLKDLRDDGTLKYISIGLNESATVPTNVNGKDEEVALIEFNYFLAIIIGAVVAWMLLMYCIEAGTRWAQLIFLQIIAPIPIIGYLSPKKDGIFQKWAKQCLTTYLDLFIRMAIIYFVLLVCQILTNSLADETLFANLNLSAEEEYLKTFIYIALIIGLLLFAKKAPKMLQELFPKSNAASGSFGLSGKERLAPITEGWGKVKGFAGGVRKAARPFGRVAGAAVGAVTGAGFGLASGIKQGLRRKDAQKGDNSGAKKGAWAGALGATWGGIRGAVGGASRGVVRGAKKGNVFKNSIAGAKEQMESNKRFGNKQESGYGILHQAEDKARSFFNADSRIEVQEKEKAPIKKHNDALKEAADARKAVEDRAVKKIREEGKGGAAARSFLAKEQQLKEIQEHGQEMYKVAKFKDVATAQNAYETATLLAKSSVNKANFVDQATGTFDQAGYEKAVEAAKSSVKASDYMVAYKTEEDAQNAYNAAVKAKRDEVDKTKYINSTTGVLDEAAFNKAMADAAATVNIDMFQKGYASQEEADAAKGADIQKLQGQIDKAKDAAVKEYVATVDDGEVDRILTNFASKTREYNETADSYSEIKDKDGNIVATGRRIYYTDDINSGAISVDKIKNDFQAFSDEVKKGSFQTVQNANTESLTRIEGKIERIKSETEGSQKDGKKGS